MMVIQRLKQVMLHLDMAPFNEAKLGYFVNDLAMQDMKKEIQKSIDTLESAVDLLREFRGDG